MSVLGFMTIQKSKLKFAVHVHISVAISEGSLCMMINYHLPSNNNVIALNLQERSTANVETETWFQSNLQ